jgi:hypothetical protein
MILVNLIGQIYFLLNLMAFSKREMILVHNCYNNSTTAYVESGLNRFFHFFNTTVSFRQNRLGENEKFHFPPTLNTPPLSLSEFCPYSPRPKSASGVRPRSFTGVILLRQSETAAPSPSLSLPLAPDRRER